MYSCIINMDTRSQILAKMQEAMHVQGFQGLRTDKVIADMGITKGAFYHYFDSKQAVGYAVVDEILTPFFVGSWAELRGATSGYLDIVVRTLERTMSYSNADNIQFGCPLNNLVQEMSPLDAGFRARLHNILELEMQALSEGFAKAIDQGEMKAMLMPTELAAFVIAGLEGSYTLGKSFADYEVFAKSVRVLIHFLQSLRADD